MLRLIPNALLVLRTISEMKLPIVYNQMMENLHETTYLNNNALEDTVDYLQRKRYIVPATKQLNTLWTITSEGSAFLDTKSPRQIPISQIAENIVGFIFKNYPDRLVSSPKIIEAVHYDEKTCQDVILELIDCGLAEGKQGDSSGRFYAIKLTSYGRTIARNGFNIRLPTPNITGDQIMGNQIKISGSTIENSNIVVAERLEKSFNEIAQTQASDELKTALQELTREVGKMIEGWEEKEAKRVLRDLEQLTDEATSEKPNPKWYRISADGLIKAAENVGDIGAAVIKAIKKVLLAIAK